MTTRRASAMPRSYTTCLWSANPLASRCLSLCGSHMFHHHRSLLPEAVFFLSLALAFLLGVAVVVVQAVLYARARRRPAQGVIAKREVSGRGCRARGGG